MGNVIDVYDPVSAKTARIITQVVKSLGAMVEGSAYTGSLEVVPVLDSKNRFIATVGDNSCSFTGDVFVTEVDDLLKVLSSGEYFIDYEHGYYKVIAATSATPTITYYASMTAISSDVDVELGAVEIKNAATDDRAEVSDANTARATTSHVISVQNIDATGKVSPAGNAVDNAPFVKVGDGTDTLRVLTDNANFPTGTTTGLAVFGRYQATPSSFNDGDAAPILLDSAGRVVLSSDIEIGAVELKDGESENRASIEAASTARTTATHVLAVQHVDETGAVLSSMQANTNPGFVKITDGITEPVVETSGTKKALNVNVTDGTNDMPTMDAVGRQGYVAITDGTDTLDIVDVGASNSGIPVGVFDASGNRMPTMDDKTRKGVVQLTDGTNVQAVTAAGAASADITSLGSNVINLGSGTIDTGTQRVCIATDDVNTAKIVTAVEIMDDWDESDRAKVNVNLNSGIPVDIGVGDNASGTARVTIATNDVNMSAIKTAVEIIDNFISDTRGLVTEDNSASIKTAVEVIDNFILGSRGLVTEDNSASIKDAVETMDDWDESDRAKVNPIVGQAGIAGGTGVDGDAVPRVSLATDVPLPAGTNTIGAVGLKDALSEDMANIGDANVAKTNATHVLATQNVDTEGGVLKESTQTSIKTAVEIMDDAVYTDNTGTVSKGVLMMGADGTTPQAVAVNSNGEIKVNLETADIEIGAVEIKNSTDDTRAVVASPADNYASPTALNVLNFGMVYDGSTWDMLRGDASNGMLVNLGTNNDVTVTSGSITETNSASIKTDLDAMILGTAYHGELTSVSNSYSSGTCRLTLGAACKHLSLIVESDDDIVFAVFNSADPTTDLADTTKRFKFIGTIAGTQTSYSLGTGITQLDFLKRNAGTIKVYVDAFV